MAPGSPYTDAEVRAQIDPTPIGGGSGYLSTLNSGQIWTESDADVTVSTASEFQTACRYSPSSGETYVVWVADGTTINMTGEDTLLTGGSGKKVIAGNRGQGAANGPLVYSNTKGLNSVAYNGGTVTGTIQVQGTVEVFGIRFRGWAWDNWDNPEYPGYIPLKDSSEYYAEVQRCFSLRSDNAEIHNCEIFGWATQGMYVGTRGTPNDPHIHHNDIHDCMQTAFGYGVDCGNGRPLIEYNYINACRHGVNGSGYSTSGWKCYNNVFGPSYSQHPIDMHSQSNNGTGTSSNYFSRGYHGNAGGRMVFENNTVTCTRHISDANVQGGHRTPAIGIRGVPWPRSGDGIIIKDNRFEHDDVKSSRPSPGHQYSGKENYSLATHQQWTRHDFNFSSRLSTDDYTPNFIFSGNQTNGSTAPYDPSVGAPVNLNGDTQVNRDLTIAVRSEDNNDQIEGADVTLTDSNNDTWIRTTGSNGNAQFDTLPTGDYDIDIVVSGWADFSGSFNHNSDTTRTFRLERDLETADIRFGAFAAQAIRPWTDDTNANPYPIKYEYVGPHTIDTAWQNYDARPARADATVTTSSLSAFYTALDSAASGDIVWLDAGDYDLTGVTTRQDIPAGVTAASDGARLFAPSGHNGTFELTNDGARLTGFRLEGEQATGSHTAQGIAILPRANVTIDNCEIYNWKTAGIYVGFSSTNATIVQPTIRHCIIRDNRTDGNGYGVATYQSADPLIEYNFLANNRESLASSGQDESAYRAFDNLHSDVASAGAIFQMEMHESDTRPAESGLGATVEHNELMGTIRDNGETYRAFAQRGTPIVETTINNNWIHISTPPDPNDALNADSAIVQYNHTEAGSDTFANVTFSGNHYGTSEPPGTEGIRPLSASSGGSLTPIEGVTVTVPGAEEPGGETQITNEFGRARFFLWDGVWNVSYTHPDYHDESFGREVDVSQGQQSFDYTLTPITDARAAITIRVEDDTGTPVQGANVSVSGSDLESRHTDTSGEAVFNLPTGSFDVTASAPDLATTTETISVDSGTDATHTITLAPDVSGGEPGDGDGGPTQPAGEVFYEVCALETAADEQWNLPVLVCNAGGNSGEVTIELARGTAATLGDAIDRRRVNLDPGEARILRLSVRMAYLEQSGALEMVVHSPHDSEEFSATASGTVEEVIGPGRPGTLGGEFGGTLGGDNPRTLGRMRAHEGVIDPDIARVPGDWAITLENPAGERRHFYSVREVSPSIEHTKLSTWSAVVPADPSVPDWSDNTRAWITLDEKIQWVGYCENATLSTDEQTTHLEGRGPGAHLDDGSFEMPTGGVAEYSAIEDAVERYADDWDWYVVRPDEPTVIPDDTTLTGSRIEIIQQLHDDWGYRFLIDNREFKRAISFPPQGATSTRELTTLDWERSEGSERVYNRVEIRGDWRRDEEGRYVGGRYFGEATAEEAIERRADEYGIPEESATETYHRTDSSIESDEMAYARAEAKLRELREHDEYGGSLNALAQRMNAGLAYPMPWDEEVKTGAWSGKFDQGDGVSGLGWAFRESHRDGAITMWVKGSWSDRSEREMRMITGIYDVSLTNSDGRALGITTTDPEGLGLQIDTTTEDTATALAYPDDELPPDDEWIFLHFDWELIGGQNETVLRAGRNGTVTDSVTVPGRIRHPHHTGWIGRYNQDHYVGLIDKVSVWNTPLSDSEYQRLAVGGDITAENLIARYPFEEGPHDSTGRIHDVIGGVHGDIDSLSWGGTPQTLESVSYDMEAKTMDLAYEQISGFADHERLENLEAEIERLKRRQS